MEFRVTADEPDSVVLIVEPQTEDEWWTTMTHDETQQVALALLAALHDPKRVLAVVEELLGPQGRKDQ